MSYRLILSLLLLAIVSGCVEQPNNPAPGPPPLKVSFRKSQIPLKGLVMGIQNTSDTTLQGIIVTVRSDNEENTRSHTVNADIQPRDSITVGWMELDGWKLKSGDEVTIESKGYRTPKRVTVPEK